MGDTTTRCTPERLAEIRGRIKDDDGRWSFERSDVASLIADAKVMMSHIETVEGEWDEQKVEDEDALGLLAVEIATLRKQRNELAGFIDGVVRGWSPTADGLGEYWCRLCRSKGRDTHEAECPVVRARSYLAESAQEGKT